MKLTEKQRRFVDYYVETGNKTEAAKKAGYSEKTAASIGDENLRKPAIKAAIDARLRELEDKRIAKADEIMQFLTSTLRGEVKEERVVVEGTGEGRSIRPGPPRGGEEPAQALPDAARCQGTKTQAPEARERDTGGNGEQSGCWQGAACQNLFAG